MDITLPDVRGTITRGRTLDSLTWLRVGGPADVLFQPADLEDLQQFLAGLDSSVPVFPIGVGSNLIVRDGGVRGVVIRLGRGFNGIEVAGDEAKVGAGALDAHVARKAAAAGVDLTFLRTIPGSIGGAIRMNAGCYGAYVADVFQSARVVLRDGSLQTLTADDLAFSYRSSVLPEGAVLVDAVLKGPKGDPDALESRMADQIAKRDATQPTKDRTAGSTFRNPARGARIGGAVMNEMHANFLTNAGGATAADLENLGEEVRKVVYENSGLTLEWEIMRIGEK